MKRPTLILALLATCPFATLAQRRDIGRSYDIRETIQAAEAAGADDRLSATEEATDPALPGARIARNRHGLPRLILAERAPLTAPSTRDAVEIARDFLRSQRALFRFTPGEIDALRVTSRTTSQGATFLSFEQTLSGIPVFLGQIKMTLNRDGQIIHAAMADMVPGLNVSTSPRLTAAEAVRAAIRLVGKEGQIDPAAIPPARLYLFPMDHASARLAWRLFVEVDGENWFEMLIDASDGSLLFRHNLYSYARGRVWTKSPAGGATRQLVTFPDGWLPAGVSVTTGNNVDAFVDTNANGLPDTTASPNVSNGRASSSTQDFDFPAPDGPVPADPLGFKAASTTNLFYFVNRAHDYFYALSFDEAAGNFQTDNFGRGGEGNDPVLAAAQYGADLGLANNSAFATTPDGMRPRMNIYLFNVRSSGSSTVRDGAYDGTVVIHEYTHGVSTRLVGGRTNVSCLRGAQSGAMGEGWSDYFAASLLNDPVIGAYSFLDDTRGVRRSSYEGYRLTFEDMGRDGFEVHDDGELWAATLWDLRGVLGQALADNLIVAGLKATPCNPTMIDARDAILAADQAASGGANRRKIWEVFARHGMGASASARDGGFLIGTVFTAATDLPADLQAGNRPPRVSSMPATTGPGQGDSFQYQIMATDPDGGPVQFELLQGGPGMTVNPSTGLLQWTANFVGQRVRVAVTDAQGGRVVHGFLLVVNTPVAAGTPVTVSGPQGSLALASVDVPESTPVLQITLREGVGDANLILLDPTGRVAAESYRGSFAGAGSVPSPTSETLSINAPQAGRWTAVVLSDCDRPPGPPCRIFTDVVLKASLLTPELLVGNATKSGLSDGISGENFFRITVPPGASLLRVSATGGIGNVSLWLGHGRIPTCNFWLATATTVFIGGCAFDRLSTNAGNNEAVSVPGPDAGEWYVNVSGVLGSFNGVTLNTELNVPPTLVTNPTALTFNATPGSTPPAQNLTISDPTGTSFNWTANATTQSGGNWLQVSRTSGIGLSTIQVSVTTSGLDPGTYKGTITVTGTGLARSPQTIAVTLTIGGQPVLSVGAATLVFSTTRGTDPPARTVAITNTGGGALNWTAAVSTISGGNWLVANPASGAGNGNIQVSVRVAGLSAGVYRGTVTITASGAAGSPTSIAVTLILDAPVLTATGIVNAASFVQALARGGIASVFGSLLANGVEEASSIPLPTALRGARVLVNGVAAPLFFVSPGQINFQIPYETPASQNVTVVIERDGIPSASVTVAIGQNAPGVFTYERAAGVRDPIVVHADNRLVTPDNRAVANEAVVVYASGVGGLNNPPASGAAASADPLSTASTTPTITLGGATCQVLFAGLTPGLVGLVQFNIQLPATLPGAPTELPLVIRFGTDSSLPVNLAVR